jgi:hypothetical protein
VSITLFCRFAGADEVFLKLASGTRFGDVCSARVAAETGLVGVIMVGI